MKLKLRKAVILTAFVALSAIAREPAPATTLPDPPDKTKLSYALGMRTGMELKEAGTNVDATIVMQAVKDVLEGKPTKLQEADAMKILNQAQADRINGLPEKDKEKFSYAGGMRTGLMLKGTSMDLDLNVFAQAVKDVVEGKPTKLQEADFAPIFHQAEAYSLAKAASQNRGAGDTFLTKNAKEPGITVLPSGLQYRVIKEGTGEIPSTNDLIFIKYRGTLVDGRQFDHHDHFLTRSDGGLKGWQEALQRMKIGSKWQIFLPPDLGYGHPGEPFHHIGPDTTLIYELELLSIAQPGELQVSSGVGHGLDVGEPRLKGDSAPAK